MGIGKEFLKGFVFGALLLSGCATAISFPYKYYGLKPASWEGTLLGPSLDLDRNFMECQNNKCLVIFTDEFENLMREYLDRSQRLDKCERFCNI